MREEEIDVTLEVLKNQFKYPGGDFHIGYISTESQVSALVFKIIL